MTSEKISSTISSQNISIEPEPWRYSTGNIAIRLFFTCWLIYSLHFSSNIVREIYLALSIGDHFSFRVNEYAHMHPDLFEKEGYGWHIGSNPGVSMLAAIPYTISRPIINSIVKRVNRKREARGLIEPETYNSPWPMAREFYKESWLRGYDIKFGLAAFVMQSMCMAPVSALGVVVMFYLLRHLFRSDKKALWLAILYAFGTPVFFRTGYLNHNLMLGHIAFMGFLAMWNPVKSDVLSKKTGFFLGGLAGGTALLFDYSGAVLLLALFFYGFTKRVINVNVTDALRHSSLYVLGTLGPVCLLLFYQWKSFGHPLYPGQHWMPPVEWIERGYQGFSFPQFELLLALLFDYRYGFFVSSPLLLLAIFSPLVNRRARYQLPWQELIFLLASFVVFLIFFSCVNYTRLQFNTGIRYLSPMFPFMFIPAAIVLSRLPRKVIYFVAALSFVESWCLAMYRDVESGLGLLAPILNVLRGGLGLPVHTVLFRMGDTYGGFLPIITSPLVLFALTAIILYSIWKYNFDFRTMMSTKRSWGING